jgi:ribosome-associated protein
MDPLEIDGVVIPARDLSWVAVRAGGPGGQNVNKVASKVDLRFDLEATRALDDRAKSKLRTIARGRLDKDGAVVVTSQLTRDQSRNLEDARAKLADLVRQALVKEKPRRPTRPSKAAKRRRLDEKKHHARKKESRRGGDD